MVSSPSMPTPPDPTATAKADAEGKIKTATAQQQLNMVNQITPQGSLNYAQSGKWSDGTPQFTATTTYSPEQQQLYDTGVQTQQQIGQIGLDQSKRIGDLLGQPINLDNAATESRLMELGRSRLDPILAQQRASTETDLINRGIAPGSEAYDRAMKSVGQQENDAYNQLLLTGRGQAVQEALTQRNQPINEITALLSGSQVSQPNFTSTPQAQVAPTDYAGIVGNNYMAQMAGYNADQQKQGAMLGGLGALGGAALGGWGSFNGFGGLLGKRA